MHDILRLTGVTVLSLWCVPRILRLVRAWTCRDLNTETHLTAAAGTALMGAYAVGVFLNGTGAAFPVVCGMSLLLVPGLTYTDGRRDLKNEARCRDYIAGIES